MQFLSCRIEFVHVLDILILVYINADRGVHKLINGLCRSGLSIGYVLFVFYHSICTVSGLKPCPLKMPVKVDKSVLQLTEFIR